MSLKPTTHFQGFLKAERKTRTCQMMTNHDLFESPKLLLNWAWEDAQRFKELERAFFDGEPHERIVEFDEKFQRNAHRVRFVRTPPNEMRKLASHIVNDLRHALDQAFHTAARRFGWQPTRKQSLLYFPWAKTPTDLQHRLASIPVEIHQVIISAKPYFAQDNGTGGDDFVRQLNEVAGPNKHEVALNSVAYAALNKMTLNWNGDFRVPYNMWDPLKEELTLGYFPLETEGEYDADITFAICFRDVDKLRGRAASDLFEHWGSYVNHVVKGLERRVAEG